MHIDLGSVSVTEVRVLLMLCYSGEDDGKDFVFLSPWSVPLNQMRRIAIEDVIMS